MGRRVKKLSLFCFLHLFRCAFRLHETAVLHQTNPVAVFTVDTEKDTFTAAVLDDLTCDGRKVKNTQQRKTVVKLFWIKIHLRKQGADLFGCACVVIGSCNGSTQKNPAGKRTDSGNGKGAPGKDQITFRLKGTFDQVFTDTDGRVF